MFTVTYCFLVICILLDFRCQEVYKGKENETVYESANKYWK